VVQIRKIRAVRRGEVYLVDLHPTVGSEIKKTGPAVVIQNDTANRWSPITIVAAISSQRGDPRYPTEVNVAPPEGGLTSHSVVLLNQVRSVDKERLVRRLGALGEATMQQVDEALLISLGLIEL
jgi:mRNA interferase MazF